MSAILEAKNIVKSYGNHTVLNQLNFSIQAGELYTLLGPNGAGKTTLLQSCMGLKQIDSGSIQILNHHPKSKFAKLQFSTTPQDLDFPKNLTITDVLNFVAGHYESPLPVNQCLKTFDLIQLKDRQTGGLSGGEKRRLALAMAFIGCPKLIFLDEPTTGLDIHSRQILWDKIKSFVSQGGSLILTTHYLEEAEQLSNRVGLLKSGNFIYQGDLDGLLDKVDYKKITFNCKAKLDFSNIKFEKSNDLYSCFVTDSDQFVRQLVEQNTSFQNLRIQRASLEQAFLLLTGDKKC